MAKITNTSKWGSAKARERYPCGGMVKRQDGGQVRKSPEPHLRSIGVMDALNRSEGWSRQDYSEKVPQGHEAVRVTNEDESDSGTRWIRPSKEGIPTSARGGRTK